MYAYVVKIPLGDSYPLDFKDPGFSRGSVGFSEEIMIFPQKKKREGEGHPSPGGPKPTSPAVAPTVLTTATYRGCSCEGKLSHQQ